ncbi:hypothetical protein Zmor_013245 [Zophobas morio]|uniref:Ku domain-containing protein n=1 Tax=Zophobas morio TaxID=2755281 RepID=A0AA38IF54_9CUCU|nr:hypothetical protein Zmor_013245 [Zophobas morio]
MPPAAKKDCSVVLFDVKAQALARQTLAKICCTNFFSGSKDLTKLILLNSDVTENRLNAKDGGYDNINEVSKDITTYDPKLVFEMINENNEPGEANWLEGLYVAVKNLEEEFEDIGGIITHQILFITDLATPLGDNNQTLIDKIVRGIKKLNAFLYVVGPEIEVPFTIKSPQHVKLWMKNFKATTDNLTVLQKIISQIDNSVVCDYKMGVHLFFAFKNKIGGQPWQVPLGLGSKIQIPAQTVKVLDMDVKCKLVSTQGAIRNPAWIDAEDETVEVDASDVISGIMRHGKFVQMPENKMFQVENPRSFSVLCFTDSVNVPEYLMRGDGCYRVLPNSTPERNEALNILIDRLAEQKKYVIARRIYNNNFAPKIVVLVPKPDNNPKCFLFTSLPFNENIRVNYRERKLESAPQVDTSDEIYSFLDSLNTESDKSEKKLSLGINMMQNSNSQRLVNKGADKLLEKPMALEDVDIDLLEPPSDVVCEGLKKLWAERTVKEEKAKKEEGGGDDSDNDFDW